jgi:PAS domain S-box-containing protein
MSSIPTVTTGESFSSAMESIEQELRKLSPAGENETTASDSLVTCLIDQMHEGVILHLGRYGERAILNRKAEQWLGTWTGSMSPDRWQEEAGIFLADGVTPCTLELNPIAHAMQGHTVPRFELSIINPARGIRNWFIGSATPLRDTSGQQFGCLTVFHDITPEIQAADALREEQNRYDLLVTGCAVGLWDWNIATHEMYFSDRCCQLLGYEPGELEPHFASWYNSVHPDDRERAMEAIRRHLATNAPFNIEYRLRTQSGKYKWFRASGQAVWDNDNNPLHMAGSIDDITHYIEVEEELLRGRHALEIRVHQRTAELEAVNHKLKIELEERERMQAERQALLRAMAEAEEHQRQRIAREVHDELGQLIVGLKLEIQASLAACPEQCPSIESLFRLEKIAEELGKSAHNVASKLRPTAIDDQGLLPALVNYWERWSQQTGIHVDWEANGFTDDEFPFAMKSTVYRSVQEALNNITKHARATHVSVVLERRARNMSVIIEDNGCGFDAENWEILSSGRLGLRGMRERVELAGGEFQIESSIEAGTTILIRLPFEHHEEGI